MLCSAIFIRIIYYRRTNFKIKNKHQIIITTHKFTNLILDEYNRQGIKVTDQNESAAYVSPLIELSDAQKDILSKGDGQKLSS